MLRTFEGVGKVAWEFILALYKSYWDQLIANKNNLSFRQKVKAQFSFQIIKEVISKNGKKKNKPVVISVLPSPILAKSPKKVVEILKFFKKNLEIKERKSYTRTSFTNPNMTRETLKIKKVFPNLQNKKIENI